jgi:hypothetical protein
VLGLVPLHRELIRRTDDEPPFIESDSLGRLEPRSYRVVGEFAMRLVENALPSVFCGQLHRYSKTEGIFSRARDVTGGVWKSQSGLDRRKKMEKAERTEKADRQEKNRDLLPKASSSSPPSPPST